MSARRIGFISDTHGLLRPQALEALRGCDAIVHAGDIGAPGIIDALRALAPVHAIRGNNDPAARYPGLDETLDVVIGDLRIHVVHDRKSLAKPSAAARYDLVVSGHSHKPGVEFVGETCFLNPGSAGPRRFRLPVTVARVDARARPLAPEIVALAT